MEPGGGNGTGMGAWGVRVGLRGRLRGSYPSIGRPALLAALRQIAESRGMAAVAERAGLPRESIYRVLSPKGNPRLETLLAILAAPGFRLEVRALSN